MKKPDLAEFNIRPKDYDLYLGRREGPGCSTCLFVLVLSFVIVTAVGYAVTRNLTIALQWGGFSIFPGIIITGVVSLLVAERIEKGIMRFRRSRLLKGPVVSRIELYVEAEENYQKKLSEAKRKLEERRRNRREVEIQRQKIERQRREAEIARRRRLSEHWMSLSGDAFERELGTLYRHLGYQVALTAKSGDQGIDLILRKDGKTTVVQCKGYQSPVGPAVARELFGSMIHFGAGGHVNVCVNKIRRRPSLVPIL